MMPERIQRRRRAGWRMPEGAVYVGRPTKWGNPFAVERASSRRNGPLDMWAVIWLGRTLVRYDYKQDAMSDAVARYRRRTLDEADRVIRLRTVGEIRAELVGRDLVCWCPIDWPCHADVLLEVANAEGLADA